MRPSDSLRFMGKPVAYYKNLSRYLGGATAAILFSQLFYWSDKTDNPEGVYKQLDELCEETGLTLEELRTARKKLRERNVLIETHKRLEHKIYFRIDFDAFDALIAEFGELDNPDSPKQENPTPRNGESRFGEQGKTDFVIDQENTTLDYNTRLHTQNNNPLPLTGQGQSAAADKSEVASPANKKLSIDYDAIVDEFNQAVDGTPIPKVKVISEQRKKLVLSIAKLFKKQFGNCETETFRGYFDDFIRQANQRRDRFYYGGGPTGWLADFDYILKQKTFVKTYEDAL